MTAIILVFFPTQILPLAPFADEGEDNLMKLFGKSNFQSSKDLYIIFST